MRENRGEIYARLYQAAAEKWVRAGAASHAVALFAHDAAAQESFVWNGFGMRCVDGVRQLSAPVAESASSGEVPELGCVYAELPAFAPEEGLPCGDWEQVLSLSGLLVEHEAASPYFLWNPPVTRKLFLEEYEPGDRYFVARVDDRCAAYLKIVPGGAETFVSEERCIANVKGAYCLPEYRGKGVYAGLLSYVCGALGSEGYTHLGTDFESTNPAGRRFWLKHFTDYTHGFVRRVDETVLRKED